MSDKVFEDYSADILIVDDTPANLDLLSGMLRGSGYRVRPVPNGRLALMAAANQVPDLILLDINMPEMDGFEVCRRFKADEHLLGVPIIFISALSDTQDKVTAFKAGGVDYITKPFQFEEVEARVENHVKLRRLQRELESQNGKLEASYVKLKELEGMRDSLTHMIVHDMRSPLTSVNCFLEVIKMKAEGVLDEKALGYLAKVDKQVSSVVNMVNDVLDVSRLEGGQMPVEIEEDSLGDILRDAREAAGLDMQRVVLDEGRGDVRVRCDGRVIRRVVSNIVGNALKFTPAPKTVDVFVTDAEDQVIVSIQDRGPGIPEAFRDKVFDKFFQTEDGRKRKEFTSGLGLAFCKMAIDAHGQVIAVDSVVGEGSRFYFSLEKVSFPGQSQGSAMGDRQHADTVIG
ncbi:MAG: hybrid sensor histidine kinase/response regulator [Verrucomicrobia bacterium]|nr:hybrid sensor histidine kinase/response regulator [Verrucomicrobiota bacterium]